MPHWLARWVDGGESVNFCKGSTALCFEDRGDSRPRLHLAIEEIDSSYEARRLYAFETITASHIVTNGYENVYRAL